MIINLPQEYNTDTDVQEESLELLQTTLNSEFRDLDDLLAEIRQAETVVHDTAKLDSWFTAHPELKDVDLLIADGANGALRSLMDLDELPPADEFPVEQCQESLREMGGKAKDAIIKFLKMILDKIKQIWRVSKKITKGLEKNLEKETARLKKANTVEGFDKTVALKGTFDYQKWTKALQQGTNVGEELVEKFQEGEYPRLATAADAARQWAISDKTTAVFGSQPLQTQRTTPSDVGIKTQTDVLDMLRNVAETQKACEKVRSEILELVEKSTQETLVTYTKVTQKSDLGQGDTDSKNGFANLGMVIDSKVVPLEKGELQKLLATIMEYTSILERLTSHTVGNTLAVSGAIK